MSEGKLNLVTAEDREAIAKAALENTAIMDVLVELLGGKSRAKRQRAASALSIAAAEDAAAVAPFIDVVIEGLEKPEAQTRWECLNILCAFIKAGIAVPASVLVDAEDALFDEESGFVREAAFKYYCLYGSSSEQASEEVWPNLDEAIQCHHGNGEFNDELVDLLAFADSPISAEVAKALAARMDFDSKNAKGTLRMRSERIVAACEAHL